MYGHSFSPFSGFIMHCVLHARIRIFGGGGGEQEALL